MIERQILAPAAARRHLPGATPVLSVVDRDGGSPPPATRTCPCWRKRASWTPSPRRRFRRRLPALRPYPWRRPPGSQATAARGAAPQQVDLRPGDFFSRRYEIRCELGRGGMGVVYLAHDRLLRREVAVKIIEDQRHGAEVPARGQQARVSHENVCRVYDAGEIEDRLFISMEHIRGDSLRTAAPGLSPPRRSGSSSRPPTA